MCEKRNDQVVGWTTRCHMGEVKGTGMEGAMKEGREGAMQEGREGAMKEGREEGREGGRAKKNVQYKWTSSPWTSAER